MQTVAIGFSIGVGLITILLCALLLMGYAHVSWNHPSQGAAGALILLLIAMLIAGMAEEVVFRGYFFQTLLRGIGPLATLFITSALFALAHMQGPHVTLLAVTNIFLAGILFGMLYLRLGTLWLLIGLHAGWDFAQFLFGLPCSGIHIPIATPLTTVLGSLSWLTGGPYGLEGGVGVSVLLLGVIAIVTYSHRGLPIESFWWEWRELTKTIIPHSRGISPFDGRYYQWKLLGGDGREQ